MDQAGRIALKVQPDDVFIVVGRTLAGFDVLHDADEAATFGRQSLDLLHGHIAELHLGFLGDLHGVGGGPHLRTGLPVRTLPVRHDLGGVGFDLDAILIGAALLMPGPVIEDSRLERGHGVERWHGRQDRRDAAILCVRNTLAPPHEVGVSVHESEEEGLIVSDHVEVFDDILNGVEGKHGIRKTKGPATRKIAGP